MTGQKISTNNKNTEQIKPNTPNKGKNITSKSRNSSGSSYVKKNLTNDRCKYLKISEVFSRNKVIADDDKLSTQCKQKNRKHQNITNNFYKNDDDVDLIGDMKESERKQRVENYLNHLPEYKNMAKPIFEEMKFERGAGDADNTMSMYKKPSIHSYLKSDFFNSPYIVSNVVNFSHKNFSFNKYQTWKIRRDNLNICEKIKKLENRKLSTDYYQQTIMKKKCFPNSQAINRTVESKRIYAENMVSHR